MRSTLLNGTTILSDDELDAMTGAGGCDGYNVVCETITAVNELAIRRVAFVLSLLP